MMNIRSFHAAAVALGIGLAASACASTEPAPEAIESSEQLAEDSTSYSLAVLDSDSSTEPMPEVIQSHEQFAEDSARYLGEIDNYSYFAARPASGTDSEACLIQVGATSDDWLSGCSSINSDMVVGLTGGVPQQEVALVSDDPSTDTLEEAGWEQQAENLWQRPN